MKHLILITLLAVLSGCTTTKYVPVETIRTEYKDRVTERVDTFVQTDSIVLRAIADTIIKERWRTRYVTKYRTDTLRYERTDTITKVVEVEREPTLRERLQYHFGGWAMLLGIVAICVFMYKRVKKL